MTAASDYPVSNRHRDNPDSGKLRMTAQIIQFRDYQNPGDLASMHGDTETSLAKLSHMAAELFNALTIGPAAEEYGVPEKTCVIIEGRALSRRFAREFRCKNLAFGTLLNKLTRKLRSASDGNPNRYGSHRRYQALF
jgi:hypothetical protein